MGSLPRSRAVRTAHGLTDWRTVRSRGSAGELHRAGWPEPVTPEVRINDFTAPALVLGSSQPADHVDELAVNRAGWELVRRHSGGGAVALVPGEVVWIDVFVPEDHELWHDDVSRAFLWLGEVWVDAVRRLGHTASTVPAGFDDGGVPSVCFAGRGAGEILVAGAKVVGLSQRRRRGGARFQSAALLRWDPRPYDRFLRPPHRLPAGVPPVARGLGRGPDEVEAAFIAALAHIAR